MDKTQKTKTKFRATSRWKKFRQSLKSERKVDEITHRPLIKGFQCHHLDLNEDHYTDISDKEHFAVINRQTHDTVHWLYRYYEKDPQIIDRLKDMLDRMLDINSTHKKH